MNNPKISIIVPVYNVEIYINECVNSILNQTFRDFELILVDDGSSDDCGRICDIYGERDTRVRVIHKENGGLSSARNTGLEVCKGEYVIFIDSDDYIENNTLQYSYDLVIDNKADAVIFGMRSFYEDNNKVEIDTSKPNIEVLNSKEAIKKYLSYEIKGYSWNRLVKKDIILNNKIFFPEGIKYEDIYPTFKTLSKCNKIVLTNCVLYNYRQRRGSLSKDISQKGIKDYISQVNHTINYYKGLNYEQDMYEYIKCFEIFNYLNAINWYIKLLECDNKKIKLNYNKFFSSMNIDYKIYDVIKIDCLNRNYKIIFILWKLNLYHLFIKFNII